MGHVPYGYRIENGKAVLDETQVAAIRKLLESYLGGLGFGAAADVADIKVTHTQAKRMLQNTKYLGTDYYPAIMKKEEQDAVVDEIERRAVALGRKNKQSRKTVRKAVVAFQMPKVKTKFDNPYLQAEYAFSLIEEVKGNG